MTDAKYPIGRFQDDGRYDSTARAERIAAIRALPGELRAVVSGAADDVLDTPYREGGWTARQVCHHVADSHLNAYLRTRLAVTSPDTPTILAYDENAWASLPDARGLPVGVSLALLDGLHERWATFFEGLDEKAWRRTYRHPESGREVAVDRVLALYAWHGRHHAGHVRVVRDLRAG